MTSFYPLVSQSFDALRAAPPPALKLVRVQYEGIYERFWLAVKGSQGRPLAVTRDPKAGVELIRYGNNEPNAVLQALADHWGCAVVSEYEPERFEPSP